MNNELILNNEGWIEEGWILKDGYFKRIKG